MKLENLSLFAIWNEADFRPQFAGNGSPVLHLYGHFRNCYLTNLAKCLMNIYMYHCLAYYLTGVISHVSYGSLLYKILLVYENFY